MSPPESHVTVSGRVLLGDFSDQLQAGNLYVLATINERDLDVCGSGDIRRQE